MPLPPLAIIGAGNMGGAIIAGLRRLAQPPSIVVCDANEAARERHQAAGLAAFADPAEALAGCGLALLAVKPQQLDGVLASLGPVVRPQQLLVSILAGIPTARIEAALPKGTRVVRAMPNTPMAIAMGMIAITPGSAADPADLDLAEELFVSAGTVLRVEEARMDAVTALSGSGPAYLFRFAEALLAGATELGFDEQQAALLVGRTLEGSIAYLLAQEGFPAARLREQVTSPGGTTAAALQVLEDGDFTGLIARALRAARDRSVELAG